MVLCCLWPDNSFTLITFLGRLLAVVERRHYNYKIREGGDFFPRANAFYISLLPPSSQSQVGTGSASHPPHCV